jgi:hypothetical protein
VLRYYFGNFLPVLSIFLFAIGLFLNWLQQRLNSAQKRDEFIANLVFRYLEDDAAADALTVLIHPQDQEVPDGIYVSSSSIAPEKVRRLLHYFEKISHLFELGLISRKELSFVANDFVGVFKSPILRELQIVQEFPHFRRVASSLPNVTQRAADDEFEIADNGNPEIQTSESTSGTNGVTISVMVGTVCLAVANSIPIGIGGGTAFVGGFTVTLSFLFLKHRLRSIIQDAIYSYRRY